MVTRMPASAIGSGTDPLYVLDGADDLWLVRGNHLIATGPGQIGVRVNATPADEQRVLRIDGVIIGAQALAMSSQSDADLHFVVGETGYLSSSVAGGFGAILYAANMDIEMHGTISASFTRNYGLALVPRQADSEITLVNSGTIIGFQAVYVAGSGLGNIVTIDNSGLIEGLADGIRIAGTATAHITNTGTIRAPVVLSGGDDVFFGLHGELLGASGSGLPGAISGGAGNDTLILGAGDQNLFGGAGDDTLHGGAGADRLDGGPGFDVASYVHARTGVVASLSDPSLNTGDAAGDVYVSIEGLIGSRHDDLLIGDDGANRIWGGPGDDRLEGRGGNDTLNGGPGDDTLFGGTGQNRLMGGEGDDRLVSEGDDLLFGGAGADTFVFAAPPGEAFGRIRDFEQGTDRIALDGAAFGLAAGPLDPAIFVRVGEGRTEATRLVFNEATGALLWDADGRGGDPAVRFGSVGPGFALTADDFEIV
ncbi:calcium-binding protein [Rubellimicrobium sp. CFH 75288]|uniref:calcium-binding protein n=1 Tax=Rubellimicrobium sp. CFH 75288 TaxID=2697034 RepID=UPI0014124DB8|nr:calcium-binding protein [Rubellimicrobium sp. CFH 75288]NAZ36602.1 hypothetical protein [Rubellimicrobium sp. CFH 75288]